MFEERNAIHTAAMEKLAFDKHLFAGERRTPYELRFNEYAIPILFLFLFLVVLYSMY